MMLRLASLASLAAIFTAPVFADDCTAPVSAMTAAGKTPHKLATTSVVNGKGRPGALIQTADKIYIQVNGKWRLSQRTPEQSAAAAAEITKTSKYTCKSIGSESVGGEAATIYAVHTANDGIESDNKVWISNSKHLPLKTEAHFEGNTTTSTYDYANVQAPPGVN